MALISGRALLRQFLPRNIISFLTIAFSILNLVLFTFLVACGGGTVTAPPVIQPLAITSSAPPAGTVQSIYGGASSGFSLAASGGTAPYVWTWTAAAGSSLPAGLGITNSAITGTPTAAGNYSVVVTVADAESPAARVSATYAIAIAPPVAALQIVSASPPAGTVASIYNRGNGIPCAPITTGCVICIPAGISRTCPVDFRYQLSFFFKAQGGQTPYLWTWAPAAGSSLPLGLTLFSNGSFRGTPTAAGSYNVVVNVADSSSTPVQTSATYTIFINPPPPPVINTVPAPATGALNKPYSSTFKVASGGQPPFIWSENGALPQGLVFGNDGTLSGMPTALGSKTISVMVQDAVLQNSSPQDFKISVVAHGFAPTGGMGTERAAHSVILLASGKVLVAGGITATGEFTPTAELFNPANGSFTATGMMGTPRASFTATLLISGKVLVTGGGTNLAEVFDPAPGTFSPTTGGMETIRSSHTATLLNNGKVLVTGGTNSNGVALATAELFDPTTASFTSVGDMTMARFGHTATLLNDGTVLLAGGTGADGSSIANAELFNPMNGAFTATGSMAAARYGHTATLLANGKVLVAGGFDITFTALSTAELFDAATGMFTSTGDMQTPRAFHAAARLNDGTVLLTGGQDGARNVLSSADQFDPAAGTFAATGSMTSTRNSHTATLLNNGLVLVTGGVDAAGAALATVELYQ